MERKGGCQNFSKFQMHHRTECDTSLESWCSEVSENILYNMFAFFLIYEEFREIGGKKLKFQMHHRTKCDISLKIWYSEVFENILYNMFAFSLIFANL